MAVNVLKELCAVPSQTSYLAVHTNVNSSLNYTAQR